MNYIVSGRVIPQSDQNVIFDSSTLWKQYITKAHASAQSSVSSLQTMVKQTQNVISIARMMRTSEVQWNSLLIA